MRKFVYKQTTWQTEQMWMCLTWRAEHAQMCLTWLAEQNLWRSALFGIDWLHIRYASTAVIFYVIYLLIHLDSMFAAGQKLYPNCLWTVAVDCLTWAVWSLGIVDGGQQYQKLQQVTEHTSNPSGKIIAYPTLHLKVSACIAVTKCMRI